MDSPALGAGAVHRLPAGLGPRSPGAPELEPAAPRQVFRLAEAFKDALAVYYFPGMWNWSRAIVRPLATEGFVKSMTRQRATYETAAALTSEQEIEYEEQLAAGKALLEAYYEWAPGPDEKLTPVQVEWLFDIVVPHPEEADVGLLTPDGLEVDYRVRVDLAMVDNAGRFWVMDHKLVIGAWPEADLMVLDEPLLNRAWAWERAFLTQARGTIHNELRLAGPAPGDPAPSERKRIRQEGTPNFRRTTIRRRRNEIESVGERVAAQVREMSDPGVVCYPAPSERHCPPCDFRAPCLALQQGDDVDEVLSDRYRKRTTPDFEPGRLGSVWGFVPHRRDETRPTDPPPSQPAAS